MRNEKDALMQRIIETYGENAQVDKVIEEMSELTKALLKHRRAPEKERAKAMEDIIDELADVRITVREMELLFQCEGAVEERINYKLKRQMRRMEEQR